MDEETKRKRTQKHREGSLALTNPTFLLYRILPLRFDKVRTTKASLARLKLSHLHLQNDVFESRLSENAFHLNRVGYY